MSQAGRFAPSPSGDLHWGNLRTALLAWLCARSTGRRFIMRIEDLDSQRSTPESAQRQLADLAALGLDWDEVIYQSARQDAYEAALAKLPHYECFCSRRDIQEAARAPHAVPGQYPGTCRELTAAERAARRAELAAQGRVPALRLRADASSFTITDTLHGPYTGDVDDFILRRGGQAAPGPAAATGQAAAQTGAPAAAPDWAYNLAVVVDDAYSGIDQVVRGDDLLPSTPRQAYLAGLLGVPVPEYIHVPLVINQQGQRLAKRDGAVTLRQLLAQGLTIPELIADMATSLGYPPVASAAELREVFNIHDLDTKPSVWPLNRA